MKELLLVALLPGSLSAHSNDAPRPPALDRSSTVGTATEVAIPAVQTQRADMAAVLATAQEYVGARYRFGGMTPSAGFDCSGFVQFVFARHDVRLPRTAREMSRTGRPVRPRLRALRAGDLLFFRIEGSAIDHVALYAGSGRIIHSSSSGGVRYDDLASARGQWFQSRLVAARRVVRPASGTARTGEP